MTKSNETIYEFDIERNTVSEIQTLYDGNQVCSNKWNSKEKGLLRIMEQSVIPVRNEDDILNTLRDRDNLDKILKQELSEEAYDKWKDKILNFFKQISHKLDMGFNYKYEIYSNGNRSECFECGRLANIRFIEDLSSKWRCLDHSKEII